MKPPENRTGGPAPNPDSGLKGLLFSKLQNASLKNKIFFSTTAVILLISVVIALFTRWILISGLTAELKRRGMGIAHSIAEGGRSFILTEDIPNLTSLIFDARLGERRALIDYVFILDKRGEVLAHTFTRDFPPSIVPAHRLAAEQPYSIRELRTGNVEVYDIAVPVKEGIYQIGSVRLGLYKKHIDQLIGKLRTTFLGFVSAVTVIFFIISHWLSRYITRPISELTVMSDAISRGDFDIGPVMGGESRCWEVKGCERRDCPAHDATDMPCWYRDETLDSSGNPVRFPEKLQACQACNIYRKGMRDEMQQLATSFYNMARRIRVSQARLKESEGKYRSLFTSGPNPIFVLDRRTLEILDANPSAEEAYGYSKQELVGRPITDLGPFELARWQPRTGGPAAAMLRVVGNKVQYFRRDGVPVYVNVHACRARYADREALIAATTDITMMVEKENQLIQASKMKTLGEMSAGIAHELNQPLNAIKMGSEFLEMMIETRKRIPGSDLKEVVQEVSRQVDRAAEIILRLRTFGRKSDFSREKISVNDPVQSVLDILGKQLRLQNIDVQLNLELHPPLILAHNNRMEQVVFNLLTNARDALNQRPESGAEGAERWIRIRTAREGDQAVVSVSDNGTGIPEALREKIFEAFFTTKEMGEGMGLGLSISFGIVEDYGGDIQVQSREGEGTTFRLSFPVAAGGECKNPVRLQN